MKNCDKNIESLYIVYLDANNLYGWAMSQKLPVDGLEWVEDPSQFNESFIKGYDKNSDKGYSLKVDVEYPKKLFNPHSDLPVLPERKKIGKCNKVVCTVQVKENYIVYYIVKSFKTSAKSRINTKKSAQCNSI